VFGAGTACLAQPVDVLLRANGEHIRVKEGTPASEQVRPHNRQDPPPCPLSGCVNACPHWLLAG